jgi:hypothetical protein
MELNCAKRVTAVHIETLVRDLPGLAQRNGRRNFHDDLEAAVQVEHLSVKGLVDGRKIVDMVLMNEMEGWHAKGERRG